MGSLLLALVEAFIDASPELLKDFAALLAKKQQQYPSVLASVESQTADNAAALEKTKKA